MILLVDIGNTRIKWAQFDVELSHHDSTTYQGGHLLSQLDALWGALPVPRAIYIANVGACALDSIISSWVEQKWGCSIHFIKSSVSAAGVTNGYLSPTQLGVDRWLSIIAGHHLFIGDVCIFDCGTAMTMDLINADGLYQGGLIFPGLFLMQKSLLNNTVGCAITPSIDLPIYNQAVAKNTQDGVVLGSIYAALSIIKTQSARLQNEFNLDPTFIITGGDAGTLIPHLPSTYYHYPYLVLQGLSLLIKNNE